MIESAQYSNAEQSSISVVFDGKQYSVPVAEGNGWYQRLLEWVHQPSDQWYQDWEGYAAARDSYNEWVIRRDAAIENGEEFNEPEPVVPAKPPELTELPVVNPIADYVAPAPPPISVTPWQFRKALNQAGYRQAVEDAVAVSNDYTIKDGWEYATEFVQNDPFVLNMATAINVSQLELDNLFELAASL